MSDEFDGNVGNNPVRNMFGNVLASASDKVGECVADTVAGGMQSALGCDSETGVVADISNGVGNTLGNAVSNGIMNAAYYDKDEAGCSRAEFVAKGFVNDVADGLGETAGNTVSNGIVNTLGGDCSNAEGGVISGVGDVAGETTSGIVSSGLKNTFTGLFSKKKRS